MPGRGRPPDLTPEEAERVRAEMLTLKGDGSNAELGRKLGMRGEAVGLLLKPGGNSPSEKTARRVAELRQLPDGFWRARPSPRSVTKSATEDERVRWVAQQLGLHPVDIIRLWRESVSPRAPSAIGDEEMHGLPEDVWSAAMATVHLEDVSIEQALRAAVKAWADLGERGGTKKSHWLEHIKERLTGRRRESGSYPRIRLGPAEKK